MMGGCVGGAERTTNCLQSTTLLSTAVTLTIPQPRRGRSDRHIQPRGEYYEKLQCDKLI